MKKKLLIVIAFAALILAAFFVTRSVNIDNAIETGSLLVLAAILFAETGLLFGFFLPGDTLLFAAGFFAAQGKINFWVSLVVMFLGTLLGNIVGYEIGRHSGPRIFKSDEAVLFSPENVEYAEAFYKKHGGKTIIIARFIPIVRTLAPLIAGIGKMPYKLFTIYNIIGGILWVGLITTLGYWAGRVLGKFFNVDKYILPAVILVTTLTFGISFWHLWREPKTREKIKRKFKKKLQNIF